jgi:carbonic anhydrase
MSQKTRLIPSRLRYAPAATMSAIMAMAGAVMFSCSFGVQAAEPTAPQGALQSTQPGAILGQAATGSGRTSPVAPAPAPGSELAEIIKRGATMEEIAKLREPIAGSPQEAIYALKTGNARFFGGLARRPEMSANERRAQILSQTPFAGVLGCSDSRVPTEIVYDQGLGSLFIARVAGNVVDPGTAGSLEYAINHLKVRLLVVMGHEGCGAVAGAMLPAAQRMAEAQNVRYLLDLIQPAVANLPAIRDTKARMREAVISNVRLQVHRLKQNPAVQAAVQRGQVQVIGAYYEIGSGAVDFLETDEELRLNATEVLRSTPVRGGNSLSAPTATATYASPQYANPHTH